MSGEAESSVFTPRGPVNTGTGHQFNGTVFIVDSSQRLVRVGRDPRTVEREHLDWLNQRFVEPEHYGRARELLAGNGGVLLTGAPGSGRRATAQMLLHRVPGAQGQIRQLPDDPEHPSGEPMLDARAVDSGQRLLLDLSRSEETYCDGVLGQLPTYRAAVQNRGARLVVVLPDSWRHHRDLELGPSAVEIIRPNGEAVFRRYLRCDGITRDAHLDVDGLTTQLHSGPMEHIAALARLVRQAKELEPTQTFAHWLRGAFAALTKRGGEVAEQVKSLRSGQQRALLLTTAMFSGAHADVIFASASQLRAIDRHPADDRPRLEWEDLAEQLAEIGATADATGQVRFTRLAYDQAVRTHFWTNFPNLREAFRNWVGATLGHPKLSSEDRYTVVTRFAEQALSTDRHDDLPRLVEKWVKRTDARGPSRLLPQATWAVQCGLNDERHSRFFRQQLLTWSRNPALPPDLAQVVVQMCSEVLSLTYPEQAMVRLHHIVRRHTDTAGTAARDVLLCLVNRNSRMCRFLLDRLMRGLMTAEYAVADLALFLELIAPDRLTYSSRRTSPLIDDETVRDQLVTGWRAALDESPSLNCSHYVGTWLAACEDERYRELLLTVLIKAGDGRNDLLSRLYVMGHRWARADDACQPERISIADCLNNKIDFAQGLDFTGLDLGDRTEGTRP
jgi:hypothetical protein